MNPLPKPLMTRPTVHARTSRTYMQGADRQLSENGRYHSYNVRSVETVILDLAKRPPILKCV